MSKTSKPEEGSAAFAEEAALTDLLGANPKVKILAVLLSEGRDINISRIADQAGVSRSTVYDHIDDLQDLGVVEQTRTIGGSPLYQLNKDSETAKQLAQLEWSLLDEYDEE
jgi:DNA-binding transcriptional ArsR family regulator